LTARHAPRRSQANGNSCATIARPIRQTARKYLHVPQLAVPRRGRRGPAGGRPMEAGAGHFRKRRREFGGLCAPHTACHTAHAPIYAGSDTARRLRLAGNTSAAPCNTESSAMTARTLGIREAAVSAIVFSAVLFALVSIDPRVQSMVTESLRSGSASSWSNRFGEIGDALWSAVRHQSMDNAPLLVFATVGAVLTVFMLRS
jgi:hypothetical protein